jgi:hypothetical protein
MITSTGCDKGIKIVNKIVFNYGITMLINYKKNNYSVLMNICSNQCELDVYPTLSYYVQQEMLELLNK